MGDPRALLPATAKAAAEACAEGSPEAAVAWEAVFEIVSAADDAKVVTYGSSSWVGSR